MIYRDTRIKKKSTAPTASSSSSSHLKCQHKTATLYCDKKSCVAGRKKKQIKMSRYPFNRSLFLRLVCVFRSDLHTYCTHLLRLFARIYICQLLFVCYFKVVESTTTPKLSGAVLFFSYVAIAIMFLCLYFLFFFFLLMKLQIVFHQSEVVTARLRICVFGLNLSRDLGKKKNVF